MLENAIGNLVSLSLLFCCLLFIIKLFGDTQRRYGLSKKTGGAISWIWKTKNTNSSKAANSSKWNTTSTRGVWNCHLLNASVNQNSNLLMHVYVNSLRSCLVDITEYMQNFDLTVHMNHNKEIFILVWACTASCCLPVLLYRALQEHEYNFLKVFSWLKFPISQASFVERPRG